MAHFCLIFFLIYGTKFMSIHIRIGRGKFQSCSIPPKKPILFSVVHIFCFAGRSNRGFGRMAHDLSCCSFFYKRFIYHSMKDHWRKTENTEKLSIYAYEREGGREGKEEFFLLKVIFRCICVCFSTSSEPIEFLRIWKKGALLDFISLFLQLTIWKDK